jgi:hypothetical protein
MKVTFPAFSHNAIGMEDSAVTQICDVRLLTGEADVMMRFEQDEYGVLSGGTLVNITFPDDGLSIYNTLDNPELTPSSAVFQDQVARVMEAKKRKWVNLVDWVADTFTDMLNGNENVSYHF